MSEELFSAVLVSVSPGELLDKISILEIKSGKIDNPVKLKNVQKELIELEGARDNTIPSSSKLTVLYDELKQTNNALWLIEDEIRRCERLNDFGEKFVELARSVYKTNDVRALLKRQINELLGSPLLEEKHYEKYET